MILGHLVVSEMKEMLKENKIQKKEKKLCQCVKKAQIPSKRNPNYQNCNILNKNVVLDYDPNVKLICTSPH
jgi:hypothetical protein